MPKIFLSSVLFLYGCKSCITPSLPQNNTDEIDSGDTAEQDTADSGSDTAALADLPCDIPEEEPNNTFTSAQEIPLEALVCGAVSEAGDEDAFRVQTPSEGWLDVRVVAEGIGSSADMQLLIEDAAGAFSVVSVSQYLNPDPRAMFPIDEEMTLYVRLQEQFNGYGENCVWEMRVTESKAPTVWDLTEEEDTNDTAITATQILEDGDRVYGVIDKGSDRDWFLLDLPDVKSTVSVTFEAWGLGSPLDARVSLYSPSRIEAGNDTANYIRDHGITSSDNDPIMSASLSTGGQWGIMVEPSDGAGSPAYWYVMEVGVELEDTGL